MFIEILKCRNRGGKFTLLGKAIEGVEEVIKLYDSQYISLSINFIFLITKIDYPIVVYLISTSR